MAGQQRLVSSSLYIPHAVYTQTFFDVTFELRYRRRAKRPWQSKVFNLSLFPNRYVISLQGTALKSKSLIQIYECLCDETRLRILNLLNDGPLCVCHLQEILGESQVKVSKHLRYLKSKDIVRAHRHRNMMIYHLPIEGNEQLEVNLLCLRECVKTVPVFINDKEKLYRVLAKNDWLTDAVAANGLPASKFNRRAKKAYPLLISSSGKTND